MPETIIGQKKYSLLISYDGTHYSGWQRQPNAPSIQEEIEKALETILKEKTPIVGAGRTDAGVHAKGQVAHFEYIGSIDLYRFLPAINSLLPKEIRILEIKPVTNAFHARYSALSKIYHYHIWQERPILPFYHLYRHHYTRNLSMDALRNGMDLFIGKHDFTTFSNRGSHVKTSVRILSRLEMVEQEGGFRFEFEGNGFLYKMVRNITGTLLEVASGKRKLEEIPTLFEAKDRRLAGIAAPAKGLFLISVHYPKEVQSSEKEE